MNPRNLKPGKLINLQEPVKRLRGPRKNYVKYTEVDKHTYETNGRGIEFKVEINGKSATEYWVPVGDYPLRFGLDVNELRPPNGKRLDIFIGGGTHKSYELHAYPTVKDKQPKDLRFTGQRLDISPLKAEFKRKVGLAIGGNYPVLLSKEFLEYFNIN